jgi:hypothetical protein
MKNEFINYEQALALKELGFNEPCLAKHDLKHILLRVEECKSQENAQEFDYILAPLYQQAFRWFREKYNLVFNFISYSIVKPGEYHWSITWNDEAKASGIVKTYEEAEQACLDKLIEIAKNK